MGMTGEVALVLAKKYVQATAAGLGAVKGAPATIQQIADIDGGHRITFGWAGTDGTQQTSTLDVMNGAKGDPGYTPVKGTDYSDGKDGDPGYSPTITVTNIAGGHKVTVTSEDGPTSFNVMDGEPFTYDDFTPEQLEGLKGADGISPIVTITGTTGGHIVSFTDKDGVKDFVVKDGTALNDDEVGLTTTFSSDKITKTFATLEEVNKRIPQHYVLPTPTEACNGQVVQFIGITTGDYVHNYFYECTQVENNYKWVNVAVQNVPTKVSELTNDNNFVTETELNEKGYLTEHQDISGKVDKEEGKSLIADSEITRLSTVKNYDDSVVKEDIATIKTDYATKTYVGEQIAAADHLKREIVTEIPTVETAAENVIYMLKVKSAIGADKYKEYMLIDGEVACVGDTSVDLTDYAKKSEIPTELPADGGNADTVNNHTVETDVPTNAVFTDTVYDDTEIKDDLSTLKYDNTHGGENLCSGLDFVNAIVRTGLSNITVDKTQGTIRFSQNNSSNYKNNGFIISDSDYNFKENTQYSVILTGFSEDSNNLVSSICIYYTDGSVDDTINLKGTIKDIISYTSKASKTIKCIKYEFTGQNYKVLYYNECGVFEGVVSEDDFRPYIPSVKMLADEVNQQNESLDTLKYSNIAGGRNLFNPKCLLNATYDEKTNTITVSNNTKKALDMVFKENTQYTFSAYIKQSNSSTNNRLTITYTDGTSKSTFLYTQSVSEEYISETSQSGKTISEVKWNHGSSGTATFRNFQIEEGTTATPYEPYIPSVKMLAEENAQQSTEAMDIKMLGWTVPSEYPIQNYTDSDGVFHQRVGRVDLGSLDWIFYNEERCIFQSMSLANIKSLENLTIVPNLYVKGYATVSGGTTWINKNISMAIPTSIIICDTNYTTVEALKNAMRNQYLYYELTNPVTIIIDGNEIGETVGNVRKETTVNLLNPTLETTASNGVTLTANGDGTYTLNGTATSKVALSLGKVSLKANKSYKLIAQSPTDTSTDVKVLDFKGMCFGDGTYKGATPIITPARDYAGIRMVIEIAKTTTLNNFIVNPMITTNLDATYDDFVPYTGNTGGLNSDVAEIRNEVSQQSAKINSNTASLLKTIHEVYSMKIGNSAVDPVVISDFKIDPGYRYLYIINGSGTTGYEVGILMFINGMKFVPLSSSDSATAIKDSVSAIGIDIYIEQGQLKVSRSAINYGSTCVIYKLG